MEGSFVDRPFVCPKIVLLGTAESGKSTLAKQMRALFDTDRNNLPEQQVGTVRGALLLLLREVMDGMGRLGIDFELERNLKHAETLLSVQRLDSRGVSELRGPLAAVWADAGLQQAVTRGDEFHLCDQTHYFFRHADRILGVAYQPTEEDVLRVRMRTSGVARHQITTDDTTFHVIDMGGLRSERRKWNHRLRDVDAVFFVASLTDWCLCLYEDESANRMRESLQVLADVAGQPLLADAPICLFLSKYDLLEKRFGAHPEQLQQILEGKTPEEPVTGARSLAAFIKSRFLEACPRCSQVHIVDLIDPDQTSKALNQAFMLAKTVNRRKSLTRGSVDGTDGVTSVLGSAGLLGPKSVLNVPLT